MNQPRILVTGGSGLLGSYLLRWFIHNGFTNLTGTFHIEHKIPEDLKTAVHWKNLVLPDIPGAFDVVKDNDWVVHAAGLVSYNHEDRYRLLDINKTGTEVMVNACLGSNVEHLIYIGSIAALGKEKNHDVLNEQTPWIQNQYSTNYGLSKYLAELEVWRGAGEGLNVSVILPAIILGTGDWNSSSLQLVSRVAHKAPWYPGGQTGYVDVRDVAEFAGRLLVEKNIGERWILNASNMSYRDMYLLIAQKLGIDRKYREAPEWLARMILLATNLKKGRLSVPELVSQVYGTFTYEASKSLTLDGFQYRKIENTVEEIAGVYLENESNKPLQY